MQPLTKEIFEKFLEEAKAAGLDEAVVLRLKNTLFGQGKLTEKTLRAALFEETGEV